MARALQDLRYALRMLAKSPVLTAVAVVSLALGIGANATIFTVINAIYFQPLPLAEPERLVVVFTEDAKNPGFLPVSAPNVFDLRDQNETLSALSLLSFLQTLTLTKADEPVRVFSEFVSDSYFDVLGIPPALGRTLLPGETTAGSPAPVVVLSHGFWERQFAGDPQVVGKSLVLNGQPLTIVGVMPESFHGAQNQFDLDLWLPWTLYRQVLPGADPDTFHRRALFWLAVGRLKPGVALDDAEADLRTIAARLEQEHPDNRGRSVRLLPLAEALLGPDPENRARTQRIFGMLMAVVGLVLLIACANVANLLLASSHARAREIAIRLALGAARRHLVRQFFVESLVLAVAGGALGLFLAFWSRDLLVALRPPQPAPLLFDPPIDSRVLGFTAGVTLLSVLLFGLAPALKALRVNLVNELKDLRVTGGGRTRWTASGNVFVAGQVALSLIALVATGLFVRSLQAIQRIETGFDGERLAVVSLDLATVGYDAPKGKALYRQVLERAASLPGVESAALAQTVPLSVGGLARSVFLPGQDLGSEGAGRLVQCNAVTPGYFATLGLTVLRGRAFTRLDRAGAPQVVIVNETMAAAFWPDEDPVGQRFRFHGDADDRVVVGVVGDSKYFGLLDEEIPYVYYPFAQNYVAAMSLFVSAADPRAVLGDVRQALREVDRNLPLVSPGTMADVQRLSLFGPRMITGLLGTFGLLALTLAMVGIFGVVAYSVSRRHREIGIRMAMGARRSDVLRLVLAQGMALVAAGLAVGLLAAWAATRLMASVLYGVSPTDPLTFAATPLLLAAVAWAAILQPARRAIAVDPSLALRYE